MTEVIASRIPAVVTEAHYRYADWPSKTQIYFDEGTVTMEVVPTVGYMLFVRIGQYETACLTLNESRVLLRELTAKIDEQAALVERYGEGE
jgi:hypothetical protein